jgi:NADH-quinone oxidoreductase subunit G
MPTLTIDKRSITVPAGTKVIEAAEALGIMIPRFCYHPALGSVGACRMCAVGFKEGPVKGVEMSCMIETQEGMVVDTDDPEAVDFRRHVIELLMLHHPHDCPVCDEGGHCLLQDTTISGGHGRRRYRGLKRTHRDQDLGPLVQHEMNRCIQCYRCARYYQEFSGYTDLGVTGIGSRVYFGRSEAGTLESPFTGNLTDICPTGVFTDKPSRFYGRRWDYERAPGVCLHCSLGCGLTVSARYRKVVRHEARFTPEVNGHFICDRGRYAYAYASLPERPRETLLAGRVATLPEALHQIQERLALIAPDRIALAGGSRSSLETQSALVRLGQKKGWQGPCFSADDAKNATAKAAVDTLTAGNAASLQAIEGADTVLVIGCDPLGEAPMLALALRQAWRGGARILTVDPRPVRLPCPSEHLAVAPHDLAMAVRHLISGALEPSREAALSAQQREWFYRLRAGLKDLPAAQALQALGRRLTSAQQPALVCGTALPTAEVPGLVGVLEAVVRTGCMWSGIFFPLPGAGSFGAALFSRAACRFEGLVAAMESGHIKALVAVENDLFSEYPDGQRLEAALANLELLVVMDHAASELAHRAQIFIPTQTVYEAGGRYLNNEGRLGLASPVIAGGLSIAETGRGDHPPRRFEENVPGDAPQAAGEVLKGLMADGGGSAADLDGWQAIEGLAPGERLLPEDNGQLPAESAETAETDAAAPPPIEEGRCLVETEATFGTEFLAARSAVLAGLIPAPTVTVSPETAAGLGWRADGEIPIPGAHPALTLKVVVDARTAPGVLVVPRYVGMDRMALRRWAGGLAPG